MLKIYAPAIGEFVGDGLNAVAQVIGTSTYTDAQNIMLGFATLVMAYTFVNSAKLKAITTYILTTFIVLFGLVGVKTKVAVIDMQYQGAGPSITVDHVPLGLALPASIISTFGYSITQLFSDVLHMPDEMEYNKSGMIFGARTWLSSSAASFSESPVLSQNLSTYLRQCVFRAKILSSKQITKSDLIKSTDLKKLIFESPSPVYRVIWHNGDNISCGEAAARLQDELPKATESEMQSLANIMTHGDKTGYQNFLEASNQYYMKMSASAADILTQNILMNEIKGAAQDAFNFEGIDASIMNYTNTSSIHKMNIAEANSFFLASYRLPYYMSAFWLLTICIFPLMALIALIPSGDKVFRVYLQSQAYLWTWPPMFVVIHWFVSLSASTTISLFGEKSGGVSFSNIESISNKHMAFAYVASALASSVPFLAYYLTKGLPSVLGNAAQHFGGIMQSISGGEAQAMATGNLSMANYSGWNANYDTLNAHKHDTNALQAHGRSTTQTASGAMLTENANGSYTLNSTPAISSMATNLHASSRIHDSLAQNASHLKSQSEQHRVMSDEHMQTAGNKLMQFGIGDSHDERVGSGVSNSTDDSYSKDIRAMQSAINAYNDHHTKSKGASADAYAGVKVNTKDCIPGKVASFITGASAEGRAGVSLHARRDSSVQEFLNSDEGKSFSDAYNHLQRTAHTNHLDKSDGHNLSASEQIAYNLSKGASLLNQSSNELSQSEQFTKQASHVEENASTIDSNYNQAYFDYVKDKYHAEGVSALAGTDANSLNRQQEYADEFMSSSIGQSMLSKTVGNELSNQMGTQNKNFTEGSRALASDFESNSSQIEKSQTDDIKASKETSGFNNRNFDADATSILDESGEVRERTNSNISSGKDEVSKKLNLNKGKGIIWDDKTSK